MKRFTWEGGNPQSAARTELYHGCEVWAERYVNCEREGEERIIYKRPGNGEVWYTVEGARALAKALRKAARALERGRDE